MRTYWNEHIHDLSIATQPVGSPAFFAELEHYRFEKLDYLARVVDFDGYPDAALLEVGCGVGLDLARFARGGAVVTGIDLAPRAIELARAHFAQQGLAADLQVMDGQAMAFQDGSFDVVYAHGVLQYTVDPQAMVSEIHRVLRPGGRAILMAYNRYSWLSVLSRLTRVELEHVDAPVLTLFSIGQFRRLLTPFRSVTIQPERFPVKTRLHSGWKARLFNLVFVNAFQLLPRRLVRPLGWHLMAFCRNS